MAKYVPSIEPAWVGKGRCGLCGHRFLLHADAFHPSVHEGFAPTLDRIIPRSLGGGDKLNNFQPVHRAGKDSRGDREDLERLPMRRRLRRANQRARRADRRRGCGGVG